MDVMMERVNGGVMDGKMNVDTLETVLRNHSEGMAF